VALDQETLGYGNASFRVADVIFDGIFWGLAGRDRKVFAIFDIITSKLLDALQQVTGVSRLRTMAVVDGKKSLKSSDGFGLSLNVYSLESEAEMLGDKLGDIGASLQHPYFIEGGFEYWNPMYYDPSPTRQYLTHVVGMTEAEWKAKRISDSIETVLASLGVPEDLEEEHLPEMQGLKDDMLTTLKRSVSFALFFLLLCHLRLC